MSQVPRGFRNNNPLNIKRSFNGWLGKVTPSQDPIFETFTSMIMGIRAAMINLRSHILVDEKNHHQTTLEDEIKRWAPPAENDSAKYIAFVCAKTQMEASSIIQFHNKELVCNLIWAMSFYENGQELPLSLFQQAYELIS